MTNRLKLLLCGCLLLVSIPTMAKKNPEHPAYPEQPSVFQVDVNEFTLSPQTDEQKYKVVQLTKEVYPYLAEDYGNLRVYSPDKLTEIPYVLRQCEKSLYTSSKEYHYSLTNLFVKDKDQYWDFALKDNGESLLAEESYADTYITTLSFDYYKSPFVKQVELYGSYDGVAWEFVQEDNLYYLDNSRVNNTIVLNEPQKYTYYRLKVLNHADEVTLYMLTGKNVSADTMNLYYTETCIPEYTQELDETMTSTFTVQNPYNLNTAQLEIKFKGNYNRNYTVQLYDKNNRMIRQFSNEVYNLSFSSVQAYKGVVLENVFEDYAYAKIIVANYDDAPLELESIKHTYYLDQVIFETAEQGYKLVLLPIGTPSPTYDMATYQALIENEPMDAVHIVSEPTFVAGTAIVEETPKEPNYSFIYLVVLLGITGCLVKFVILPTLAQKDK